jgi:HD domain
MNSLALFGIAAGVAGSGIILYSVRLIRNDLKSAAAQQPAEEKGKTPENPVLIPSPEQREKEHKHTLEVYSGLWKKNEDQKNTLKELAKIWRADVNDGLGEAPDKPMFLHREVKLFYKDFVDGMPFFNGNSLRAIVELLKLLDTKGKCPSVVNKHKDEPEIGYDKHVYKVLKKIPLYEHSTNVAREMMKIVPDASPLIPKYAIAGLCHDIGKITMYYDKLHTTGVHAFIAVSVVDKLTAIHELKFLDEIIDAVKNHHRNPETQLGKDLKKADQEARRKEIAWYDMDEEHATEQTAVQGPAVEDETANAAEPEAPVFAPPDKSKKKAPKQKTAADLLGAGMDTTSTPADLFGEASAAPTAKEIDLLGAGSASDAAKTRSPHKVSIPWFDFTTALAMMEEVVNRGTGQRWNAISTPEGTVYFRQEALFNLVEKLSNNSPDIKVAKTDPQTKNNIIYSLVLALRDGGAIEETMCSEKYPGAMFVVNPEGDEPYEVYLTPIKAEKFGLALSEMEKRKGGKLKGMVITPKSVVEAQ